MPFPPACDAVGRRRAAVRSISTAEIAPRCGCRRTALDKPQDRIRTRAIRLLAQSGRPAPRVKCHPSGFEASGFLAPRLSAPSGSSPGRALCCAAPAPRRTWAGGAGGEPVVVPAIRRAPPGRAYGHSPNSRSRPATSCVLASRPRGRVCHLPIARPQASPARLVRLPALPRSACANPRPSATGFPRLLRRPPSLPGPRPSSPTTGSPSQRFRPPLLDTYANPRGRASMRSSFCQIE